MKTPEQMFNEKQERIDKAIKRKEFRETRQQTSISISWAINNAVNSLSENEKGKTWGRRLRLIKNRKDYFLDIYREYMLENMPIEIIEPVKLTKQDFAEAKREAPKLQALQNQAEELKEEKDKEDDIKRANIGADLTQEKEETLPIINIEE